jgi:O-acetyl-ADP-ribose deacetylase (regulator of RNase III)
MLPKIYLTDNSPQLIKAWKQVFDEYDNFEITLGDYFSNKADAIVSPANSFGIMDGGLDLAIRDRLGFDVETNLQQAILTRYHGELPIGSAILIPTNSNDWPFMIAAPTMRIPENISHTLNPYMAFRAILLAVKQHNESSNKKIMSLLCPGLGAGIGQMEPCKCTGHMRAAFNALQSPPRIPSYNSIHSIHKSLNSIV